MDWNKLMSLLESFYALLNLEVLSLAHNPLAIPKSIKKLHLKKLIIDNEQKVNLPKDILDINTLEISMWKI